MSSVARSWGEWVSVVLTVWSAIVFLLLWAGLAIALLSDPAWLDRAWSWVRGLPGVVEIAVWVLFLPITVTLWLWQAAWPITARLAAFAAIVVWTSLAASSLWRLVR